MVLIEKRTDLGLEYQPRPLALANHRTVVTLGISAWVCTGFAACGLVAFWSERFPGLASFTALQVTAAAQFLLCITSLVLAFAANTRRIPGKSVTWIFIAFAMSLLVGAPIWWLYLVGVIVRNNGF